MKTIDLHVHSNFSDGTCKPEELVDLAIEKGLAAFALTDHDSVGGVESALAACEKKNTSLQVIPGIEISTDYEGHDIHIVGLFVDYHNEELVQKTRLFVERRENRNAQMVENLQKAGIPITMEDLIAGNPDMVITRAHFAKYLISHNIVKDVKEAFSVYLGEDTPYFVPRAMMKSVDGIRLILQAGGIPILAHPMHYKLEEDMLRRMIQEFKDAGLVGMEVMYSNHSPEDDDFVAKLAKEYELLPSGGSDFHGSNKPAIHLGSGRGNLNIPYEFLKTLAAYGNYSLKQ